MTAAIETEKLTKYYGHSRGIMDVDLTVEAGQRHVEHETPRRHGTRHAALSGRWWMSPRVTTAIPSCSKYLGPNAGANRIVG